MMLKLYLFCPTPFLIAVVLLNDAHFYIPITQQVGSSIIFLQQIRTECKSTDKFNQLFGHRALRLHPLKGHRAGQYAMTLTGNYRLVIEKVQEDIVRIVNVEDYHDN